MKVLIACEYSGVVRDAFLAEGHDAISCDLLPTESPGPHIQGDVRPLLKEPWDLVVAHPPCQRLTQINDVHPKNKYRTYFCKDFLAAVLLFYECMNANAPMVAVENPRMHSWARRLIRKYDDVVQPYEFGDPYSKATCFWFRNVPPLVATVLCASWEPLVGGVSGKQSNRKTGVVVDRGHDVRGRDRSRFHPGMAKAMAQQWGTYAPSP